MSATAGLPTVLVVDTDPLWRAAVASRLGERASSVQYATLVDAFVATPNVDPDVFVLGPGLSDQIAEMGPLTKAHPHLAVVAVVDAPTVDLLQQAVRSGVRDVVDDRREERVAEAALESAQWAFARRGATRAPRRRPKSYIVAVVAAKGGVGTTSVAVSLAAQFARSKQTVALADVDTVFGDIAMFLGMPTPPPVEDVELLNGRVNAGDLLEHVGTHKATGLTVFTHGPSGVPVHQLPKGLSANLLGGLQQDHTLVVADMPAPLTSSLHLLPAADRILLLTEHTPSSLKNTLVARKMLQQSGIPDAAIDIVLNRVPRPDQVALYDLEQLFGTPVVGVLPETQLLISSVEQKTPLVKLAPREPWSQEVTRLADRVLAVSGLAG